MSLKLNSSGGGSVTLQEPNTASALILNVPAVNGNLVTTGDTGSVTEAMIANSAVTPAKLSQKLTLETVKNSTSGTTVDFDTIPSWVNRITMMLNGVSTNGSSIVIVQLGDSGGIENTGYTGANGGNAGASGAGGATPTSGHGLALAGGATSVYTGIVTVHRVTGNTWVITNMNTYSTSNSMAYGASVKSLSGTLDRIRLTTVNGTDTFDAGSVNILYEG